MHSIRAENYRAWGIDPATFPTQGSLNDQLRFILQFALLAPSGHNSQPWNFSIKNEVIYVFINQERSLAKSDPEGRQLLISIGCAIENLLIGAEYYGFLPQISYFPEPTDKLLVAKITLTKRSQSNNNNELEKLISAVFERYTNRSKYSDGPAVQNFISTIKSFCSNEDTRTHVITEGLLRGKIAELAVDAQIEVMREKAFREELSEYLKPNFTKSKIGMPGFVLNMPLPLSIAAPWLVRLVNLSEKTRKQDTELLKDFTPAFGIISTSQDNNLAWIKTGRLFERLWLLAVSHKLSCAPLAAIIQNIPSRNQLRTLLNTQYIPQVFFRLGFNSESKQKTLQHTPRFNLQNILIPREE